METERWFDKGQSKGDHFASEISFVETVLMILQKAVDFSAIEHNDLQCVLDMMMDILDEQHVIIEDTVKAQENADERTKKHAVRVVRIMKESHDTLELIYFADFSQTGGDLLDSCLKRLIENMMLINKYGFPLLQKVKGDEDE